MSEIGFGAKNDLLRGQRPPFFRNIFFGNIYLVWSDPIFKREANLSHMTVPLGSAVERKSSLICLVCDYRDL